MFSIQDVLTATGGELIAGCLPPNELAVRGVTIDSRTARPGDLFVAIRGETVDGHQFVGDAIGRGATAALVRRGGAESWPARGAAIVAVSDTVVALGRLARFWRAMLPLELQVVGITGSVGKSSTKELAYALFGGSRRVAKSPRSFNNELGLPLSVLAIPPDAEVALLEMGTYGPGELASLATIAQPHIAAVTNVGPSHLERMGSLAGIAAAKAELVAALPDWGVAVLNADDPLVLDMASRTMARALTYGQSERASLRATAVRSYGAGGIGFALSYQGQTLDVGRVPLLGVHHVYTALTGVAIALAAGLTLEAAIAGLRQARTPFRATMVPGVNGSILLDDSYNASPVSAHAALAILAEVPAKRRIAVLGDMLELGAYEEAGHREVGRAVARIADELLTIGPRARTIGEEARRGGMAAERVHELQEKGALTNVLRTLLREGDVALIKGSRGLAMETVVAALREPDA